MLPPTKRRAVTATPVKDETEVLASKDATAVAGATTNIDDKLNTFCSCGDLIIETSNVRFPKEMDCIMGTMRSINTNNYDSIYLKKIFKSECKNEMNFYNHRIPIYLAAGETKQTICMKCNISENDEQDVSFQDSHHLFHGIALNDADLSKIGLYNGCDVVSFLLENHEEHGSVIIILTTKGLGFSAFGRHRDPGYNIYSIDKEKWIFEKNYNEDKMFNKGFIFDEGARALLFEKKLLIISFSNKIYFYNLTNLMKPKYIGNHILAHGDFNRHGMVCMEKKDKEIKILLFGGIGCGDFSKSFLKLSITCDFERLQSLYDMHNKISSQFFINSIKEERIETHGKIINMSGEMYAFGYITLMNANNERIVCIVDDNSNCVFLFNCATNKITQVQAVLPKQDDSLFYDPSVISHGDHLHVIYAKTHCLVNLRRLLRDEGEFKDLNSYFFWQQERIIWIGFEKNRNNNECLFAKKDMSKDVVRHIVSFLRIIER